MHDRQKLKSITSHDLYPSLDHKLSSLLRPL